jgi:hypothetical protein
MSQAAGAHLSFYRRESMNARRDTLSRPPPDIIHQLYAVYANAARSVRPAPKDFCFNIDFGNGRPLPFGCKTRWFLMSQYTANLTENMVYRISCILYLIGLRIYLFLKKARLFSSKL